MFIPADCELKLTNAFQRRLSDEEMSVVADRHLEDIERKLLERHLKLKIEDSARILLRDTWLSSGLGSRGYMRMETRIMQAISQLLLHRKVKEGGLVCVYSVDRQLEARVGST